MFQSYRSKSCKSPKCYRHTCVRVSMKSAPWNINPPRPETNKIFIKLQREANDLLHIFYFVCVSSLETRNHELKAALHGPASTPGASGCSLTCVWHNSASSNLARQICSATSGSWYFKLIWLFVNQTRAPCFLQDFRADMRS